MPNVDNDALSPAQVVANEYEAYLHSDSLDPAWIAGWHAAINHATHVLASRVTPPYSGPRFKWEDLICSCVHKVPITVNGGDPPVCGLCFKVILDGAES